MALESPDAGPVGQSGVAEASSSKPAEKRTSQADAAEGQLVAIELSAAHGEDGRLLRMFVSRNAYKKPEARTLAAKSWLIHEEFYDEWVGEYIKRYAPKEDLALQDEDPAKTRETLKVFEDVLKKKPEVDRLEKNVQDSKGDVFMLRDALLSAVKELRTPRRRLGIQGESKMSPETIEALKFQRQERLREVVRECLEGIWRSGVGGEVLKVAMEQVHVLIERFEEKADDVRLAIAGPSWHKLRSLVGEIEGELPEMRSQRAKAEIEGRNTKMLVQRALDDLGGKASTQEIFEWIEQHPEVLEEQSNLKINKRAVADKQANGKEVRVWHNTVRGVLTINFQKSRNKREDGAYVWSIKGAADSEPAAIQDGSLDGRSDAPKKARTSKAKAKLALADGGVEADANSAEAATSQPKGAKRKSRAAKSKIPDEDLEARREAVGTSTEDALQAASSSAAAAAEAPQQGGGAAAASAAPPAEKRPRQEGAGEEG